MTHYVCGFFFSKGLSEIVLIWKEKPRWQKGKLNGIGGKIEPGETPLYAMQREFKEETGIDHEGWNYFITLSGSDWCVYFFCSEDDAHIFEYAETKEREEVAKIRVDRLDDFEYILNLRWLIPMAQDFLSDKNEIVSIDRDKIKSIGFNVPLSEIINPQS